MQEAKRQEPKPTREPIEQTVHVDCSPDQAFELFTERFAEWWPAAEDRELHLGTILEWDPPHRVKFAWPPHTLGGQEQTVPEQTVDVRFIEDANGTRVTLTHEGWHRAGVETCAARFSAFACEQLSVMA